MREGSTASPELEAIADFLRACVPFDTLDPGELSHAVANIRVSYHRAGEHLPSVSEAPRLSLVRTGAVDIRGADGELVERGGGCNTAPGIVGAISNSGPSKIRCCTTSARTRFIVSGRKTATSNASFTASRLGACAVPFSPPLRTSNCRDGSTT